MQVLTLGPYNVTSLAANTNIAVVFTTGLFPYELYRPDGEFSIGVFLSGTLSAGSISIRGASGYGSAAVGNTLGGLSNIASLPAYGTISDIPGRLLIRSGSTTTTVTNLIVTLVV